MPKMQVNPSQVRADLRCYYRVPFLSRPGFQYVDCQVIGWESSHKGQLTTVILEPRDGRKGFITTVPRNLYF